MQFPIGVFGVAIATVTLPAVSVLKARQDMAGFGKALQDALRLTFFLTLPAATGLAVLAHPIIQVIYEHGRFSASDTAATAMALQAYALGLVGYSAIKVLTPCFYALGEAKAPLRVSLWGMGVNVILNGIFFFTLGWGHVGLAFSTSLLAVINFSQLLAMMARRVHLGAPKVWFVYAIRLILATLAMAIVATLTLYLYPSSPLLYEQMIRLIFAILLSVLTFFSITILLQMKEPQNLFSVIRIKAKKTV
jgi:putative peptidoglycan lipid II flippase